MNTSKWWHISLATEGRQTLFPQERLRREALHRVAAAAPNETLLYGIIDDHLHQIAARDEDRARNISRSLRLSLAPLASCRFERSYVKPVDGRTHLRRLVNYVVSQPRHHELVNHPALWTGSCFQDLVGARWLPGLELQLRHHLPRLRLRDVLPMFGLPSAPVEPATLGLIQRLGPYRLAEAASTALVAPPSLEGRSAPVLLARRAVAQIASAAGFAPRELTRALGWPTRTLHRYGQADVPIGAMRAIGVRLGLEVLVSRLSSTGLIQERVQPRLPPLRS